MVRELTAGEQMLCANDLATARGKVIDARDARIAELEGDVVGLNAHVAALDAAWGEEQKAHAASIARWQEAVDERDDDIKGMKQEILALYAEREEARVALEQERNVHAATKAELAHVSADCATKAELLRNCRSAWEALLEALDETLDALGVPALDGLTARLAWLRDNAFQGRGGAA